MPLPETEESRKIVSLLLELGLTGPEVPQLAPWMDPQAVNRLIAAADDNWGFWQGMSAQGLKKEVGERVNLTFIEFKASAGFKYMLPVDASPTDIRSYWRERELLRERERKRRCRAKSSDSAKAAKLPSRVQVVFEAIPKAGWTNMRELEKIARKAPIFRQLKRDAILQAIHRAVRTMGSKGLVVTKFEVNERGLKKMWVHRSDSIEKNRLHCAMSGPENVTVTMSP
jgi:hypothetical protein